MVVRRDRKQVEFRTIYLKGIETFAVQLVVLCWLGKINLMQEVTRRANSIGAELVKSQTAILTTQVISIFLIGNHSILEY